MAPSSGVTGVFRFLTRACHPTVGRVSGFPGTIRTMSIPRAFLAAALSLAAPLPLVPPPAHASAAACRTGAAADFNGDGFGDLAVAAPYDTVDGRARAGTVAVFHGSPDGLVEVAALAQGSGGVPGEPEVGDSFGSALAVGDFDRDGCADLAIGVSEEFSGRARHDRDGHGVVHVLYGSPHGLGRARTLDVRDLGRRPGTDRFGAALAAGDLDGDGDDELAVGAPGLAGGGGVAVFGLSGRRVDGTGMLITKRTRWVRRKALQTDQFGAALAAGDFDGDGRDELAIGAPGEGEPRFGAGGVTVVSPAARRAAHFTQDTPGMRGRSERWDGYGAALAAGDFDGDGRDDLAIGVPGEGVTPLQRGMDYGDGAVSVLYGSRRGLTTARDELWTQEVGSIKGRARYYDRFGSALAAADLNGDGDDELVIGVPGESAVQVLAGTRSGGLTRDHNVLITGPRHSGFGAALATGEFTGDRAHDLVVAAPNAGRLTLLAGSVREGSHPGVGRGRGRLLARRPAATLLGYAMAP
mgnify:CR=1 FL=1